MEESKTKKYTPKMECMPNESIMFYGTVSEKGRSYRLFYGLGVVYRIVKGEKSDLVYVNFGIIDKHKARIVVIYDNHARRQLLTLKRGQICQIYGLCRYSPYEWKGMKRIRLGLYARGIIGWYVPTMYDIKRMDKNEDLVSPSEKEKEFMENYDEILDSFTNGKEDL